MVIQRAIELFKEHQKGTGEKSTLKSYGKFREQFKEQFAICEVISDSADQIGRFLDESTEGLSSKVSAVKNLQRIVFSTLQNFTSS